MFTVEFTYFSVTYYSIEGKPLSISATSLRWPHCKAWVGFPVSFHIGFQINYYRAVFLHFLAYQEEQLYSSHIFSPLQKIHCTLFSRNSKTNVSYLEITRVNVAFVCSLSNFRMLFHCGHLQENYIDTVASFGSKRRLWNSWRNNFEIHTLPLWHFKEL